MPENCFGTWRNYLRVSFVSIPSRQQCDTINNTERRSENWRQMKHQQLTAAVTCSDSHCHSGHCDHRSCPAGQLVSPLRWPSTAQVLTCHWLPVTRRDGPRRVGAGRWLNTAIVHDQQHDDDDLRWAYSTVCRVNLLRTSTVSSINCTCMYTVWYCSTNCTPFLT